MRARRDYCPPCRRYLDNEDAIATHNIACAESGERQYAQIAGVTARTVEATRIKQGAGVHAKEAYPR
jgi:hypothetical protein